MAQSEHEHAGEREHADTQQQPPQAHAQAAPVYPSARPPAWLGHQYPVRQPAAPVAPRRSNRRAWTLAIAALVAALVGAGTVFTVGSIVRSHSASPAAASPSPGPGPGAPRVGILNGSLPAALLPPPPGATVRRPRQAGAGGTLTLDDYLALLFPTTSETGRALLTGMGFESAATSGLHFPDGKEADFYLVEFAAPSAARSYALGLSDAYRRDRSADPSFPVAGLTDGTGFEDAALDSVGDTYTFICGAVGNVTLIFRFYVPATLNRTAALSYLDSQVARLTSAEATTI